MSERMVATPLILEFHHDYDSNTIVSSGRLIGLPTGIVANESLVVTERISQEYERANHVRLHCGNSTGRIPLKRRSKVGGWFFVLSAKS